MAGTQELDQALVVAVEVPMEGLHQRAQTRLAQLLVVPEVMVPEELAAAQVERLPQMLLTEQQTQAAAAAAALQVQHRLDTTEHLELHQRYGPLPATLTAPRAGRAEQGVHQLQQGNQDIMILMPTMAQALVQGRFLQGVVHGVLL